MANTIHTYLTTKDNVSFGWANMAVPVFCAAQRKTGERGKLSFLFIKDHVVLVKENIK